MEMTSCQLRSPEELPAFRVGMRWFSAHEPEVRRMWNIE
jgi:hypothetical protein